MPNTFIIPAVAVEKLKQEARKLKRSAGIPHHEALEQVARAANYPNWHVVAQSATTTSLTEKAFLTGLIIALDVKDAGDFDAEPCGFVEDDQAHFLGQDDMREAFLSATNDDGVLLADRESAEETEALFREDMANYCFFRFVGPEVPATLRDVHDKVSEGSFWAAQYVWLRGAFHDTYDEPAKDPDGRITGVRF